MQSKGLPRALRPWGGEGRGEVQPGPWTLSPLRGPACSLSLLPLLPSPQPLPPSLPPSAPQLSHSLGPSQEPLAAASPAAPPTRQEELGQDTLPPACCRVCVLPGP